MNEFQAQRIAQLRKKNKMSQRALGRALGVSDRAVSKWENGLSSPSGQHLVFLSRIFGVPVEYFLHAPEEQKGAEPVRGMESLTELYKIGRGPSSSHTIGPERACRIFKERNPSAERFEAVLYGSLAKTGKGHGTDTVIQKTFAPVPCTITFDCVETQLPHPNTMELSAYREGEVLARTRVLSVGGGSVVFEGAAVERAERIYALDSFSDIAAYCEEKGLRLWEYALEQEGEDFSAYMQQVWDTMKRSVRAGLSGSGTLPGGLNVQKKARSLHGSQHIDESAETRENRLVCAYAFAVGEQNASGETIVTAPTCGAAGVVPAVLFYQQQKHRLDDEKIVHALMSAGIIGNLIKTNASISGAECGCQAEIGSACAMAAAALGELYGLDLSKIEYAAEIAIEHHLGLTCDPVCGLVQIPCIERNAVAAMRAINAVSLASFLWDTRKVSFDRVVQTMKETGLDMHTSYKETGEAGLARLNI